MTPMTPMPHRPRLSHYSYDSLGNPWVSGGGAVRDFEVLRRMVREVDVTLYTARHPGFRERDEDGIRIRGLGFGRSNLLCRLTFALSANLRILFDRADRIVTGASLYAPVLTGCFRGSRHAIFLHHYVGREAIRKYGIAGYLPYVCERLLLRAARRYLVVNAAVRDRIREVNRTADVLLTANGFGTALLATPRAPSSPPFVLFLGRFDLRMKGLDLLIPAWVKTLAPRGIKLVLAGRGTDDDARALEEFVPPALRSDIRLERDVSEARKRELLSTCLFFASPSRFEGFGIAALEANAAGVAVLATDTEGFRDSLAFGETALAVPVEDAAALEAGLARLAEDEALRDALGKAGRERARAFSWDAIAAREREWVFGATGTERGT